MGEPEDTDAAPDAVPGPRGQGGSCRGGEDEVGGQGPGRSSQPLQRHTWLTLAWVNPVSSGLWAPRGDPRDSPFPIPVSTLDGK